MITSEIFIDVESKIIMLTITGRCSREDWQMSVNKTAYRYRLLMERVSLEGAIEKRFQIHNDSTHGGNATITFSQGIAAI